MKKLLVFGATGATGRQVVSHALEQGYEVTAFMLMQIEDLREEGSARHCLDNSQPGARRGTFAG